MECNDSVVACKNGVFALQKEWRKPQARCLCHQEKSVNDLRRVMTLAMRGVPRFILRNEMWEINSHPTKSLLYSKFINRDLKRWVG